MYLLSVSMFILTVGEIGYGAAREVPGLDAVRVVYDVGRHSGLTSSHERI